MFQEVSGDILLSRAEVIAHGVSPHDNFDHGLALALRERWPGMYKDFRHYCHQDNPEVGGLWAWAGPGARLVALFTQAPAEHHHGTPGRATTAHVNHALRALRHFIEKEGVKSVALPRLATGVGGLDWDEVRPLIEHHLGGLPVKVILYTGFHPGQSAAE